jgi:hypothetical protein
MTHADMAIEILEKTSDGHNLYQSEENIERYGRNGDGWQLALIQTAVNGHLNERGEKLFEALHRQAGVNDYSYPLQEFVAKFVSV